MAHKQDREADGARNAAARERFVRDDAAYRRQAAELRARIAELEAERPKLVEHRAELIRMREVANRLWSTVDGELARLGCIAEDVAK